MSIDTRRSRARRPDLGHCFPARDVTVLRARNCSSACSCFRSAALDQSCPKSHQHPTRAVAALFQRRSGVTTNWEGREK